MSNIIIDFGLEKVIDRNGLFYLIFDLSGEHKERYLCKVSDNSKMLIRDIALIELESIKREEEIKQWTSSFF